VSSKRPKTDRELLAELEGVAARIAAMSESLADATARRDFLIVALQRRGLSLRQIGAAAGVHHTRVRQLSRDAATAAKDAGLRRMHPKGKRGRPPEPPAGPDGTSTALEP